MYSSILAPGFADRRAVRAEEHCQVGESAQAFERAEVVSHVAFGRVNEHGAEAHHVVARDERARPLLVEAEVAARVARRVQRAQGEPAARPSSSITSPSSISRSTRIVPASAFGRQAVRGDARAPAEMFDERVDSADVIRMKVRQDDFAQLVALRSTARPRRPRAHAAPPHKARRDQ